MNGSNGMTTCMVLFLFKVTDSAYAEEKEELRERHINMMAMTFDSEEAAYVFFNAYAKERGFSIRKDKVKRGKGAGREIRRRRYLCSNAGKWQKKLLTMEGRTRRLRPESRCKCTAQLVVKRDLGTGKWFVHKFDDVHNHILATHRPKSHFFGLIERSKNTRELRS